MVLDSFKWFWKDLGGFGRVWEGWGGGIFYMFFFSGFAIYRSKKYIKVIKSYIEIDAVNPCAAADNHPPTPGHNG